MMRPRCTEEVLVLVMVGLCDGGGDERMMRPRCTEEGMVTDTHCLRHSHHLHHHHHYRYCDHSHHSQHSHHQHTIITLITTICIYYNYDICVSSSR